MKTISLALLLVLCLAVSALAAAAEFTADKPSPLKLARPAHGDTVVRFTGTVRIATQSGLGRETVGGAEVCPHRAHHDAVLQPQRAHLARLLQQHGRLAVVCKHQPDFARSAACFTRSGSAAILTPARSCWSSITERESRPSQPRLHASVISA